jgi:hypothetical protein
MVAPKAEGGRTRMLKYILLLSQIILISCDIQHAANPDIYYKRDAIIKYGGREYIGVAVLPKATKYDLEFKFNSDLTLFTLRTCHREFTQDEFRGGGWFSRKDNSISITYTPQAGIESPGYCPVEIGGFDAKGRHAWAVIDFESEAEKLSALVKCNGNRQVFNGVSICQSLQGLLASIVFPVKTQAAESDCFKPETKDQMTYNFQIPSKRCVYVFREMGGEKRFHRFTTIGYESVLLRTAL